MKLVMHTTGDTSPETKMDYIHICGERDTLHNKHIQTHRHSDSIPDQKHHSKPTQTERTEPRQILIIYFNTVVLRRH
jgi:hypothetical protein